MYRTALEAADHALVLFEAALDRHLGRPARVLIGRVAALTLFGTPLVWMIAGFRWDPRAASGLVIGVALYALLLGLQPAWERMRAMVSAIVAGMFRSRA